MLQTILAHHKQYLDLTIFMNDPPSRLLYFFHCSDVYILLDVLNQIQGWSKTEDKTSPLSLWKELLENDLKILSDIKLLQENPYISCIGPYYYAPTNTRFFFTQYPPENGECMSTKDLEKLYQLLTLPKNPLALKDKHHFKNQKKSSPQSLSKEIDHCQTALTTLEKINRHVFMLEKMKQHLIYALQPQHLSPLKPEFSLVKPEKIPASENLHPSWISFWRKKKATTQDLSLYQHQIKIYYISYREFEKACDRYKEACIQASERSQQIQERLNLELLKTEEKLRLAEVNGRRCHNHLTRSSIHEDYHDLSALARFSYYLKTGRAQSLSDCMNLYEEECRWNILQLTQERLEKSVDELHPYGMEKQEMEAKIQHLLMQSELPRQHQLQHS